MKRKLAESFDVDNAEYTQGHTTVGFAANEPIVDEFPKVLTSYQISLFFIACFNREGSYERPERMK